MIRGIPHLRMVAKKELFAIPIFGWVLSRAHFIPVDRKSRNSGIAASSEMKKKLAKGICVWVAPEGTRSPNGELKSFRKGSFAVAMEAGIPVQPVVIWNSYLSCPKGSLLPRPGTKIVVEILDPIEPSHPSFSDRGTLCDETRSRMENALKVARKEHPSLFIV
jgi:1-acyl-sn-glycerol-3-phosphate acyltransferase